MKKKIIDLMERTLLAYSEEHIQRYFDEVKSVGLTEHGFPRLTANIGILIAHGRRRDLLPIFLQMMDFCTKTIPLVSAANDFSVREIISSIREVEAAGVVPSETILEWRSSLKTIVPETCYDVYAKTIEDPVKNWALFTGVSEYFRQNEGLADSEEFIEIQLGSQLKWFDENGMYMDAVGDNHQPIVYDLVPRGLFVMLLNEGYRGRYYEAIDDILRRSALHTLKMQSPNGEVAFGGRSNQFIHNEPWLIMTFEYEVNRYKKEGNLELMRKFRAASMRAIAVVEYWLSLDPIYHTKNRFPTETKHGCEHYAYFDKYMITVASMLHGAYLVCDDTIPNYTEEDTEPSVFATTDHFHKIFMKSGGYGLEFDVDADDHYDAMGLGRVHKAGAPSAIGMSVPCPSNPGYTVTTENNTALSYAPGVLNNGEWIFATGADTKYDVVNLSAEKNCAVSEILCRFASGEVVKTDYAVNCDGVLIEASGKGDIAYMIPVFYFDGAEYSEIRIFDGGLEVNYKGWRSTVSTDGKISGGEVITSNRNGHYKEFFAVAKDSINLKIEIKKC